MDIGENSEKLIKPKVVRDAAVALASMVVCEEALEMELLISTSYAQFTKSSFAYSSFRMYLSCDKCRGTYYFGPDLADMFQEWRSLYLVVSKACIVSTARYCFGKSNAYPDSWKSSKY